MILVHLYSGTWQLQKVMGIREGKVPTQETGPCVNTEWEEVESFPIQMYTTKHLMYENAGEPTERCTHPNLHKIAILCLDLIQRHDLSPP